MLKIVRASDPLPVTQVVLCVYSQPGLGKTSLAFTAADPLLLDCDKGAYRAANRKDSVLTPDWNAMATLTPEELTPYKTVILDTAGRALDLLTADIIRQNPKMGRGGALTLQGFGELKSRFAAYLRMLRTLGKDVVLIAHMDEQRNGDDTIERLDIQGSSKTEIYKSVDAMGRIVLRGADRSIDFNPRENAFGKNPCSLPLVPFSLDNRTCLADVITTIKQRLNAQAETEKTVRAAQEQTAGGGNVSTVKPAGNPPPSGYTSSPSAPESPKTAPTPPNGHVKGVLDKVETTDRAGKPLKTRSEAPYMKLNIRNGSADSLTYFLFDNAERIVMSGGKEQKFHLFDILAHTQPTAAIDFQYSETTLNGKLMRNIKEVTRVGLLEWEEGTGLPIIQRGPANPEVTDDDILP